ncbi:unnamed protein product [Plutella xylostella]|uniref:(diamondback moth) hypothetical protein n=1 Tax=Plutella xylostella TaxID=51655 RepID=A0A8S4G2R7_PLUXY|nr:unnamed protein product [Plutella xylostella]
MDVLLYNSAVCRLCGEENENGTLLYSCDANGQNLGDIINKYLPLKVADDGQLPRTLCPGCTIQLEATVEFFNLIISGQKIIRELHQREKEYKKSLLLRSAAEQSEIITEKIVYEINTSDGIFHVEHPIALQVAGLERPRRKRGRPPKKTKSPEELAQEIKEKEEQLAREAAMKENFLNGEAVGKRRRKTPTRFREAVQGKELERIFIEEGMIDPEEKEVSEEKPAPPPAPEVIGHLREAGGLVAVTRGRGRGRPRGPEEKEVSEEQPAPPPAPEVIGHLREAGGLVAVTRGRGRGRPRGRTRPTLSQCSVCGLQFSCSWRYMSHLASHQRRAPEPSAEQTDTKTEGKVDTPQQLPTLPETSETTSDNIAENINSTATDNTAENGLDNSESTIIKMEIEQTSDAVVEVTSSPVSKPEGPSMEIEPAEEESELVKGKKKLKCNVCDKMFSNRQSKSMHMKDSILNASKFIWLLYGRSSARRRASLPVQECGLSFPYPRSLSVHALRHRRAAAGKGFACDLCGKCRECGLSFPYPRSLSVHALRHRRAAAGKGFACDLCGKVLNHPSSVVYHKEAEHAGRQYVCINCGKGFKHRQLLQRHQLVHTQIRPHTCKICAATFKTKANLMNHQLRHSGVKKYGCELCKQRFAHKTSLTLHMRLHSGVKPYVCGVCGKSFSQKGNLSEHERIHTGSKPYQCRECARAFTTSSQHRLHARRHQAQRQGSHALKRFAPAAVQRAHRRREDGARRRDEKAPQQIRNHKQVSLLVDKQQPPPLKVEPEPEVVVKPEEETMAPEAEAEDGVIYVTYDVDVERDAPTYHILDTEETELMSDDKVVSNCSLYSGESLLLAEEEEEPTAYCNEDAHMAVTDEEGNPLHFTMQDGTRLAITSADGKSLQVITQDGQTIPVEINGYNEDEEEEEDSADTVVHQLSLQKDSDAAHYFTIV